MSLGRQGISLKSAFYVQGCENRPAAFIDSENNVLSVKIGDSHRSDKADYRPDRFAKLRSDVVRTKRRKFEAGDGSARDQEISREREIRKEAKRRGDALRARGSIYQPAERARGGQKEPFPEKISRFRDLVFGGQRHALAKVVRIAQWLHGITIPRKVSPEILYLREVIQRETFRRFRQSKTK